MLIKLEGHTYYKDGVSGQSTVIGYESGSNRVLRVNFTTGDTGATNIVINVTAGSIRNQAGTDLAQIPFYVTTSSTSHADANAADGVAVTGYLNGSSNNTYTGSADVVLRANTKYYVWFFPKSKTFGWSFWHQNNSSNGYASQYELSGNAKFTLSISAGEGSAITVNRTSSEAGLSTGTLDDGAVIYTNDKLKITFTPSTNYAIDTRTVNGMTFASGNIHTVSGDVSIVATAQVLSSDVGATDANIGSVSTIIITKYNSEYYHTLQYSFGGLSGYITSSGGVSSMESKFSETSVAFAIPDDFYAQIPNKKTGVCKITCKTYSSSTSTIQLGNDTTCTLIVTADESLCKPIVSGSVIDTNTVTKALTGDETMLIRYKSVAHCTIQATAKNHADISSKLINNVEAINDTRTFTDVDSTSFIFTATDTRGYQNSLTVTPSMVSYIVLTCNPLIYRPTSTGSRMVMTVSGNMYRGSFGAYTNTLTLQYRYRESGGVYGAWQTIDSNKLTLGVSSYRSASEIELISYPQTDVSGEVTYPGFDYNLNYDFQVRATDGAGGYVLSIVNKDVPVNRGVPVFDWGENDFNINVNLMLNNVNILDIIYPVGTVYTNSSDTLPTVISNIGTWDSLPTDISGVFIWKRTK